MFDADDIVMLVATIGNSGSLLLLFGALVSCGGSSYL